MSKEKLHEIITESFVNDKIDVDRFLKMSEKVDKISDERAEEIVSEISFFSGDPKKKKIKEDYKKCKQNVENTLGMKFFLMSNVVDKRKGKISKDYGDKMNSAYKKYQEAKKSCKQKYLKQLAQLK